MTNKICGAIDTYITGDQYPKVKVYGYITPLCGIPKCSECRCQAYNLLISSVYDRIPLDQAELNEICQLIRIWEDQLHENGAVRIPLQSDFIFL